MFTEATQCYRHPNKPVCFFCDDCKQPICKDCGLKRETCFRHEYVPLQNNVKTLQESLHLLQNELKTFEEKLSSLSHDQLVNRIDLEEEILRKTIDDFIDSHIRAIEARRQVLRATLRTTSQSRKGCIRRLFAEFSGNECSWTNLVTSLSQLFVPNESKFLSRFHEISLAIEDVRESIKNSTVLSKIAFAEQPSLNTHIKSIGSLNLVKEHLEKRENVYGKSVNATTCETITKFPENLEYTNGISNNPEVNEIKNNDINTKVKEDIVDSHNARAKDPGKVTHFSRKTASKHTGKARISNFLENLKHMKIEDLNTRDNANQRGTSVHKRSDFEGIHENVKLQDLEDYNNVEEADNSFPQVLGNKTKSNKHATTNVSQNFSNSKNGCDYKQEIELNNGESYAGKKYNVTDFSDVSLSSEEEYVAEDGIFKYDISHRFVEGSLDIAKNNEWSEVWPPTKEQKSDPSKLGYEINSDEISRSSSWKLNSENCIGSLQVTSDGLQARATAYGWNAVIGSSGFVKGRHTWKVRVRDWSVLGVCYQNDHIECPQWWTGNKWVCIASSYSHGELETHASEDEILLRLDCEKKTLTLIDLKTKRQEVLRGFKDAVFPYFNLSYNSSVRIFEMNGKSV